MRKGIGRGKEDFEINPHTPFILGRRHRKWMATSPKRLPDFAFSLSQRGKRVKGGTTGLGRHSDGRAPGGAGSARCVRRLDGSLVPAIRITYRVSLRSSSSREPRYPSTGVVSGFISFYFSRCGRNSFGFFFPPRGEKKIHKKTSSVFSPPPI